MLLPLVRIKLRTVEAAVFALPMSNLSDRADQSSLSKRDRNTSKGRAQANAINAMVLTSSEYLQDPAFSLTIMTCRTFTGLTVSICMSWLLCNLRHLCLCFAAIVQMIKIPGTRTGKAQRWTKAMVRLCSTQAEIWGRSILPSTPSMLMVSRAPEAFLRFRPGVRRSLQPVFRPCGIGVTGGPRPCP
jgi:hypothetical protein